MTHLVLLEQDDPDLKRAVEEIAAEALPWTLPGEPAAREATVWFCAGRPPAERRALPALRWIHSGWAGIEEWLERSEWSQGVALTRTVGDFPQRIAEYVAGYLLAEALDVPEALRQMEERAWRRWTPGTLAGRTILIVGYGAIGRRVVEVARALGMTARGIRRGPVSADERARGVEEPSRLDEYLPQSDVVVNLLPLTSETRSFWSETRFARLKPGSIFVNVSRGATVEELALAEGLARGRPARAILDVFQTEPLPAGHPLRSAPGAWVTPHVAGAGTVDPLARDFAENWKRWNRGEPLLHIVDRARGY